MSNGNEHDEPDQRDDMWGVLNDGPLRHWPVSVTTEHECWGHPPPEDPAEVRWVLFDPDEDDGPIGVFVFQSDAIFAAEAWNARVLTEGGEGEEGQ